MVKKRFDDLEQINETLKRYIEGAMHGVVGHHVTYPLSFTSNCNIYENMRLGLQKSSSINVYIHWPYCFLSQKNNCDFCMCNTRNEEKYFALRKEYFMAIKKELLLYSKLVSDKCVDSIYIGGGTPLSMTEIELEELFELLYTNFRITEKTFISIESRPELISCKKLVVLKKYNIKKISIGVESLNNNIAYTMGRICNKVDYNKLVKEAIFKIRRMGIPIINVDLIYGHPVEDEESINESLQKVVKLSVDTVSYYVMGMPSGLTDIENNKLYVHSLKKLEYRKCTLMKIKDYLEKNNYEQVVDSIWVNKSIQKKVDINFEEIPNIFNNTCYLPEGIWIGVGMGSIGFIEEIGPYSNINDLEKYINCIDANKMAIDKMQLLSDEEYMRMYIVLGILHGKIECDKFIDRFGKQPEDVFGNEFRVLFEKNLIRKNGQNILLTYEGIYIMEGVCRLFFSEEVEKKYRLKENKRIDYQYYKVDYSDLR